MASGSTTLRSNQSFAPFGPWLSKTRPFSHAFKEDTSWSSAHGPGEIMTAASLPTSSSCAVDK